MKSFNTHNLPSESVMDVLWAVWGRCEETQGGKCRQASPLLHMLGGTSPSLPNNLPLSETFCICLQHESGSLSVSASIVASGSSECDANGLDSSLEYIQISPPGNKELQEHTSTPISTDDHALKAPAVAGLAFQCSECCLRRLGVLLRAEEARPSTCLQPTPVLLPLIRSCAPLKMDTAHESTCAELKGASHGSASEHSSKVLPAAAAAATGLGLQPGTPQACSEPIVCAFADTQHADVSDGHSFHGIPRFYRHAPGALRRCVAAGAAADADVCVHAGDLIDGKAKEDSAGAFQRMVDICTGKGVQGGSLPPVAFAVGNHELYHMRRAHVYKVLEEGACVKPHAADKALYGGMVWPRAGLTVLVLDSFDVGTEGWAPHHPHIAAATELLRGINPNLHELNATDGMGDAAAHGGAPHRRWAAYNGGVGAEQLQWLHEQLGIADALHHACVVFGHVPILPWVGRSHGNIAWNFGSALRCLHAHPCVVAYVAGHDHEGGYAVDATGVHHLTLDGLLELQPGTDSFAMLRAVSARHGVQDDIHSAFNHEHHAAAPSTSTADDCSASVWAQVQLHSFGKLQRWTGGVPQLLTSPRRQLTLALQRRTKHDSSGDPITHIDLSGLLLLARDLVSCLVAVPCSGGVVLGVALRSALTDADCIGGRPSDSWAAAQHGFDQGALNDESTPPWLPPLRQWWPEAMHPGKGLGQGVPGSATRNRFRYANWIAKEASVQPAPEVTPLQVSCGGPTTGAAAQCAASSGDSCSPPLQEKGPPSKVSADSPCSSAYTSGCALALQWLGSEGRRVDPPSSEAAAAVGTAIINTATGNTAAQSGATNGAAAFNAAAGLLQEPAEIAQAALRQVQLHAAVGVAAGSGLHLDLSRNALQGCLLQPHVGFWTAAGACLVALDLSHNRLTGLSQGMGRSLPALRKLNLEHNLFAVPPCAELADMAALRVLLAEGNPCADEEAWGGGGGGCPPGHGRDKALETHGVVEAGMRHAGGYVLHLQ